MTYLSTERHYARDKMSAMGEWEDGLVDANGEDCCRHADVTSAPVRLPTPDFTSGEQFSIKS